jgi:hypothetical protein
MPYCIECGSAQLDKAKFCSQCGKKLHSESPSQALNQTSPEPKKTSYKWSLIEVLLLVACLGNLAAIVIPTLSDTGTPSVQSGRNTISAVIIWPIAVYLVGIWRGWRYPVVHALTSAGLVLFISFAASQYGYYHARTIITKKTNDMIQAVLQFDKESAESIKNAKTSEEKWGAIRKAQNKALLRASDEASARYIDAVRRALEEMAQQHATECAELVYPTLSVVFNDGWMDAPSKNMPKHVGWTLTPYISPKTLDALTLLINEARRTELGERPFDTNKVLATMAAAKHHVTSSDHLQIDMNNPSGVCNTYLSTLLYFSHLPASESGQLYRFLADWN